MAERLAPPAPGADVVAVPATARARRRRYHAADLLAAAVARRTALPYAPERLVKTRETGVQSTLPARDRAENVRGAFRAQEGNRRVLLVDDVATSAATARECARVLAAAGAAAITVWCFARAPKDGGDVARSTFDDFSPKAEPRDA
jgi:predicted amidophosphoribosyltransferase